MSAVLYPASGPGGNNASLQSTTVGGSKPLHRFIKGQPKIVGVIVLVLGASFFIMSIAIMENGSGPYIYISLTIPPGFLQGALFIICGILYILTEHNPTKKTVTISLALSIVTILGALWTMLYIMPHLVHTLYYRQNGYVEVNVTETDDAVWTSNYLTMGESYQAIFLFYSFIGAIIFVVMSALAGAALRSTKSQAIVVMTTAPTETAVE
ncbi:Hypothetical protein SMAX5B_013204 [Scophthalmus maximus]|uniref:Uncharacterized protein n=1 Tax=Scophthalmus maximus TaxID=52904 RepID=A0A2U9BDS4_SCOMX|nr:uncharacterized protein si:ch1073-291c23.2 [Scophthalmus maximus]XP_035485118.1 uncharacterized protein si:ch1073-291c23.2 [Scophthalmus maximus]XP_035485119.1 uncharacterized protein si:ch1073-291c23.2 [Scophthalmus maximus]AWP01789.1 Hypothetical protein SMAX5B_013204 [Scophthalmus maximus]AWP01791.1 Hypothetical protein SMAX5B_013204 [Scophthalmus maximus]AWP01792.1 Hypothetical protein SMAX5B_013204 [Scophthalmus maximus]